MNKTSTSKHTWNSKNNGFSGNKTNKELYFQWRKTASDLLELHHPYDRQGCLFFLLCHSVEVYEGIFIAFGCSAALRIIHTNCPGYSIMSYAALIGIVQASSLPFKNSTLKTQLAIKEGAQEGALPISETHKQVSEMGIWSEMQGSWTYGV